MPTLLGADGRPIRRERTSPIVVRRKQSYDAAATNADNRRHWLNADALSSAEANSLDVRKKLRNRSRYESANNSYCRGMVLTAANDLIGTGPRLQCLTANRTANQEIERKFNRWAMAVRLAEKLSVMAQAKKVDGEPFALLTSSDLGPMTPVALDFRPIECDRVTDPDLRSSITPNVLDGITYDVSGNPVSYTVLDEHPGDALYGFRSTYKTYPARKVIHWFRSDRIGQVRGIPEITPALPLFAQLRRYTLAVIAAAETAADFAAVLQSKATANTGEVEEAESFEELELTQRMMTVLPRGWELGQLDSKQPVDTYDMFKHEIIAEIGRCLNMPYITASGDYARANYASGRLAHQLYFKSIAVERSHLECVVLSRLFAAWLDEAVMIPGYLPAGVDYDDLSYRWFWDGWPHVDPVKEANATQILLDKNATTLAEHYAGKGLDWEDQLRQRAAEKKLMRELGIDEVPAATQPALQEPEEEEETEEEEALEYA